MARHQQYLAASVTILSLCIGVYASGYSGSSSISESYNCGAACADYTTVLGQVSSSVSNCVNTIGASCGSDGAGTINDVCNDAAITIRECYKCSSKPKSGSSSLSSIPGFGAPGLSGSDLALLGAWAKTCATFEATGTNPAAAYRCWLSVPKGGSACETSGGGSSSGGGTGSGSHSSGGSATAPPASSGTTGASSPPASMPNSASSQGSQAGASNTAGASKASASAKSTAMPGSAGHLALDLETVVLALGGSISWLFL